MPVSGTLYTYPNNFRAQKALIAAKYSGANVKLAKNFSLTETVKDKAFLAKFPFGKVPAFEDDSGLCLFESSAIAFHVASDDLRGKDNVQRALVQQWVSFADNELLPAACSWVFPVVGVLDQCKELTDRAAQDLKAALNVLDQYLLHATFLAGERITLADICVACTLLLPFQNVLDPAVRKNYKNLTRWFTTIVNQPKVKEVIGEFKLCEKVGEQKKAAEPKKAEKKAAEPKAQKKADKKKDDDEDMGDDDLLTAAEKKPKDPLDLLPKGTFDMDDFKRFYSNNEEAKSVPYFWEKFDKEHYSIWKCDYKYNHELAMVFMSCNLIGGMYQRLDKMRKNAFASMCLFGENNNSTISGIWIWRGQDLAFDLCEDWQIDYTSYDWKKLDANSDETKKLVDQYFKWIGTDAQGKKFNQGKIFK